MSSREAHGANLLLLLLLVSLTLFFRSSLCVKMSAVLAAMVSIQLFADAIHFRAFQELVNAHEIQYAHQLAAVRGSIWPLIQPGDAVYFADWPVWGWLIYWKRAAPIGPRLRVKLGIVAACAAAYATVMTSYIVGPGQGSKKYLGLRGQSYLPCVKIGLLNHHILDACRLVGSIGSRRVASAEEIAEVEDWFQEPAREGPVALPFGVAKGKNLIFIQVESLQAFTIGLHIDGQEITPTLNRLAREGHHFPRFFSQSFMGATSDAEFCVMNSLLPAAEGAAAFRYQANTFHALPAILKKKGYHTFAAHPLPSGFWNMWWMHRQYGFAAGYYKEAIARSGEDPWLIPDDEFYTRVLPLLHDAPQPFFAHLLTLTTHTPFKQIPAGRKQLKFDSLEDTVLGDYLESVHYADRSIGEFMKSLRIAGLYNQSVIVIYGDHEGLPPGPAQGVERLIDRRLRGRVPLIVLVPGARNIETVGDPGGQIDIAPTVLHLLGIKGGCWTGRNLFAQAENPVTYLRSGAFLTRSEIFLPRDGSFAGGEFTALDESVPANLVARQKTYAHVQKHISISDLVTENDLIPRIRRLAERPSNAPLKATASRQPTRAE